MTRLIEFSTYLTGRYVESEYEPEYCVEAEVKFTARGSIKDVSIIAIWHELDHVEDHKSRHYQSFTKMSLIDQQALMRMAESIAAKIDIEVEAEDAVNDRRIDEIKELD